MEHLGGADAVEHLDTAGLLPELPGGVRQGLAGTDADAQRRLAAFGDQRLPMRRHLAIERGRGVADGLSLIHI